jgi:hypothetical protein
MKCALRVVLVRNRRAEQGKNAVARRLRDIAIVAMHRRHHQTQNRVNDRASVLGIEIAQQFGRALDIREQRRDGLAFAVQTLRCLRLNSDFDAWSFPGLGSTGR